MRDAHQRRPQEKSFKTIIQLTRNAERGIRSLLSILTLISRKGCARPNKTLIKRFISASHAQLSPLLNFIKKCLPNDLKVL